MHKLAKLADWSDADGNVIESPTVFDKKISVTIRGRNNRVVVDPRARIKELLVVFDCDNGLLTIGPNTRHGFAMSVRIGQDAKVHIGADVTSTMRCIVSAVEGATVDIGDDVMLASNNQIRSDDGHPIFDVSSGLRINPARDIRIGPHVWLGAFAVLLGGADIGSGSVIGFRSLVTGAIPNNCIAVGAPARVVRKDIAWERPHLSFVAPPYKPDASTVDISEEYWAMTQPLDAGDAELTDAEFLAPEGAEMNITPEAAEMSIAPEDVDVDAVPEGAEMRAFPEGPVVTAATTGASDPNVALGNPDTTQGDPGRPAARSPRH